MLDRRKFLRYSLVSAGAGTAIFAAGNIGPGLINFEKKLSQS